MAANQMSYKLLKKFVAAELKAMFEGKEQEFSYLVEGPHGIGKSAFWKEVCIEYDGFFVDLRLGQRDLGDIIGLPTIVVDPDGTKHMVHVKPELVRKMFVRNLDELGRMGDAFDEVHHVGDKLAKLRPKEKIGQPYAFILGFLDEYNRGTKDVQQAVFELVYDRSMNGDRVHPNVLLAAACNDNMEIYTITEGDPAFRSRFKTIKYTPTVDEWLSWGKKTGELCEELIFLVESKKDIADPPKGKDIEWLNSPHTNRRSWHEFSKFYTAYKAQFTEIEMRDIAATFIGYDAAEVFRLMSQKMTKVGPQAAKAQSAEVKKVEDFYNSFVRLHKFDATVAAKELKNFSASDLTALADHCLIHFNQFTYMTGVTKERITNLADLLPQEVFSKIWNSIDPKNGLKEKMYAHVASLNKGDFFKKFEK